MSESGATDWNSQVIEEFRENEGEVGGPFEGAPLLLLHHTGAKTGKERVTPLMYQEVDDGYAVFASKGGAPANPDWYYNLIANPGAKVELGNQDVEVIAEVVEDEDREVIWEKQKDEFPQFGEYEEKTDREIPVVVLKPTD